MIRGGCFSSGILLWIIQLCWLRYFDQHFVLLTYKTIPLFGVYSVTRWYSLNDSQRTTFAINEFVIYFNGTGITCSFQLTSMLLYPRLQSIYTYQRTIENTTFVNHVYNATTIKESTSVIEYHH
ncbi:hypothetical protein F4815DRAFT_251684 [Daldinia loculata]|nr:hypothetical protein F4815DRAFT_251684 [Daldinia loculata]